VRFKWPRKSRKYGARAVKGIDADVDLEVVEKEVVEKEVISFELCHEARTSLLLFFAPLFSSGCNLGSRKFRDNLPDVKLAGISCHLAVTSCRGRYL
jgi:hypothetical protein